VLVFVALLPWQFFANSFSESSNSMGKRSAASYEEQETF